MKYLKKFSQHSEYQEFINGGGGGGIYPMSLIARKKRRFIITQ